MPDKLSEELLARHEANSRPEPTKKPAIDLQKLPSLPKANALPSLPNSAQLNWAQAANNKTAAPNRATEVVSFTDLDKKDQISAVSLVQKNLGVTVESSRSSNGTTTLLIRGPTASVAQAKAELQRKLSPRISSKIEVSAEARPSILGNRGATVRQLSKDTDTSISVGDVSENSNGAWSIRVAPITINGSKQAVNEAVAKINEIVEKAPPSKSARSIPAQLAPFLTKFVDTLEIKYNTRKDSIELVGPSGAILDAAKKIDQFIEESNTSFADQPANIPAEIGEFLASDVVFEQYGATLVDGSRVYGPKDKLSAVVKALQEIAAKTVVATLDISRAHNKTAEHAATVSFYLQETGTIESIKKDATVAIKLDGSTYSISGKDANSTANAKKLLIEEVNKITPSTVLVLPGFKSLVGIEAAKSAAAAAKSKFVVALVSKTKTVLFYKGNDEDFAPSNDDIAATLKEVAATFKGAQDAEANTVEQRINLSGGDQRFVREPLGSARALLDSLVKDASGTTIVHVQYSDKNLVLSGLEAHVKKFKDAVPEIVRLSKDYKERSNYTETLKFDTTHVKNLIGRNGSNITKLRDEFDVRIDVGENGLVTLKGLEPKVRKARAEIEKTEARLNDEVINKYEVPQKYHATLIGGKGKFVRRIKDKYDVHVQFPRPGATEDVDTIVLTGPSKGVAQTKKEFKDLIEYEETHSQVQEITVPGNTLNRIIGRGGANITAIKQDTNTQIDVSREKNEDGTVTIKIIGEKKAIASASKQINAAVTEILDNVEKTLEVESKYHRFIVGPNNETRRKIISKAGGQVDPWNPRTLQVPQSSSTSTTVTITGPSKLVESIEQQVVELVETLKAKERFSETFSIPSDQFTALLGPAGSRKREVEEKNGVSIDIKRGPPCNVTIKGPTNEQIATAKLAIFEHVSLGKAIVKVPSGIALELFNRGMLQKEIDSKFKVRLTVNRSSVQKEERTPAAPELGDKPYATKQESIAAKSDQNTINWTLSGKSDESCQEAANYVESLVKKLAAHDTIGYVWFSKPNNYSQVIGPMGANINRLRTKSNCSIFVPMNARENLSPIEIRGVKADVEAAIKAVVVQAGISE